ncbi:MAG: hypothetical protein JSV56_09440, partial [Methanomassiliicoccales archaeon]
MRKECKIKTFLCALVMLTTAFFVITAVAGETTENKTPVVEDMILIEHGPRPDGLPTMEVTLAARFSDGTISSLWGATRPKSEAKETTTEIPFTSNESSEENIQDTNDDGEIGGDEDPVTPDLESLITFGPLQPGEPSEEGILTAAARATPFLEGSRTALFDGTLSEGNIVEFKWDFGDGTTFTEKIDDYNGRSLIGLYTTPTFGDFDGDSYPEFLAGEYCGRLRSYDYISGSWEYQDDIFDSSQYFITPVLVDIDGDVNGLLDLVVGSYYGRLEYFLNTGDVNNPNWVSQGNLVADSQNIDVGSHSTPHFVDLDGDTDLDLVVGEYFGNLNYFMNIGSTTNPIFTEMSDGTMDSDNDGQNDPAVFDGIDVGYYSTPAFADLDGDFDFDLLIGNSDGILTYYRNDGNIAVPSWTLDPTQFSGVDVGSHSIPTFIDLEGDPNPELVIGEYLGNLNYFRNNAGLFEEDLKDGINDFFWLTIDDGGFDGFAIHTYDEPGVYNVTLEVGEGEVGKFTSIAIDSGGKPHISFYGPEHQDLKYAKIGWAWHVWDVETVHTPNDVGQYSSIALDTNDTAHMSYYDLTNGDLLYVNGTYGSWNLPETLDSSGNVGQYTSIATDDNNNVHISYYDYTHRTLKYVTN